MAPRLPYGAIVALLVLVLAGCGGGESEDDTGPGSPSDPIAAQPTPIAAGSTTATQSSRGSAPAPGSKEPTDRDEAGTAAARPGYEALVDKQISRPARRFTPCDLVTRREASAIVKAKLPEPTEAPQGPTCIYRSPVGKGFITVAVQSLDVGSLASQPRTRRVEVAGRNGICDTRGQPTLHVALTDGRTLSITAPCGIAQRFAAAAAPRLRG